jgi:hypothetical protein
MFTLTCSLFSNTTHAGGQKSRVEWFNDSSPGRDRIPDSAHTHTQTYTHAHTHTHAHT